MSGYCLSWWCTKFNCECIHWILTFDSPFERDGGGTRCRHMQFGWTRWHVHIQLIDNLITAQWVADDTRVVSLVLTLHITQHQRIVAARFDALELLLNRLSISRKWNMEMNKCDGRNMQMTGYFLPFRVQNFPIGFDSWFADELTRQFDVDAPRDTQDLAEGDDGGRHTAAGHQFDDRCALALADACRGCHPCLIRFACTQIFGFVVVVFHQNGAFHDLYLLTFVQNAYVNCVFGDNAVRASWRQPTNHHRRFTDHDRFDAFGWIGYRFFSRAWCRRGWTLAGPCKCQNLQTVIGEWLQPMQHSIQRCRYLRFAHNIIVVVYAQAVAGNAVHASRLIEHFVPLNDTMFVFVQRWFPWYLDILRR